MCRKIFVGWLVYVFSIIMLASLGSAQFGYGNIEDTSTDVSFFTGNLTNLSQMADSNSGTANNGEILLWSTATGKWEPGASSAGDILAVNTDGPYLSGGATSGTVDLLLDEAYLNGTIISIATVFGGNSSWNQSLADSLYYTITNPFGFYNSTDFSISDYTTTSDLLSWSYYNITDFDITNYYTKTETDTEIINANTSMKNYVDGTFIAQSDEGNLNVNNSNTTDWWAGLTGWVGGWFENIGNELSFNETKLNETIDARSTNVSINFGVNESNTSQEIPFLLTSTGVLKIDATTDILGGNATCTFISSPNGSDVLEICDS